MAGLCRIVGIFIRFRLLVLFIFIFSGCSIVVPVPGTKPLEEEVIGGGGRDKALLIDISGGISAEERSDLLGLSTEPSMVARIREELDKAAEDRAVKAVILRMNTPGGTVTASDIIHHEIKEFKERTGSFIVVEMLDVAASGGYYIATAADRIIAHPTTVTGSIGVVSMKIDASGLMERIGVENETVKSGDKKDIGSPLRGMTPEEREIVESIIREMYERFLEVIEEGRKGIDRGRLEAIADGRVYTAGQALDLALIDGIGYFDDVIDLIKEEKKIDELKIVTYARPGGYKSNVYSSYGLRLPVNINLVNVDADALAGGLGMRFMYIWLP